MVLTLGGNSVFLYIVLVRAVTLGVYDITYVYYNRSPPNPLCIKMTRGHLPN